MRTLKITLSLTLLVLMLTSCSKKKAEVQEGQAEKKSVALDYTELLEGAWTTKDQNADGQEMVITTIVMDGYIAETFYNVERKEFDHTFGGSWTVEGTKFKFTYEFSSADSSQVGTSREVEFFYQGDTITFTGDERIWTRIDDGKKGNLSGAWLITGREREGEMSRRTPGPRKTMKILSDTRFQWIAYNTETKQFMGSGGGTYTAKDKEYVENIEFFSRDSSRVGASLSFEFGIENGEWHHKGLSSKGSPIHEVWTLRESLEK